MDIERATVTGWGRSTPAQLTRFEPANTDELIREPLPTSDLIARGLGRSYGDAAQRSNGSAVVTTACTDTDWVDRSKGVVRVASGATIGELIDRFAPKGWFVPVSPGTRQVTVGGAIAADVHGKNHHVDGSFGEHVRSMRIRLADDEIVEVSPASNQELFWATVGGMGLTGIVVDADLALVPIPSTTIRVQTQRLTSLDDLIDEMKRSDLEHTFSVAWVDVLGGGRSVLTQGSFAQPCDLNLDAAGAHGKPSNPSVNLPRLPGTRLVRKPLMRAFNELWWRKAPAEPTVTNESITAFFHPLDAIANWNHLYGRSGLVQWQCVVPDDAEGELHAICDHLRQLPCYLSVLKRFGPQNDAPLSFPMTGWTLAVDLPVTTSVLDRLPMLDRLVDETGGRIYLAKDARLDRSAFESMYPRLDEWKAVRTAVDPTGRFASDLSARLGL